MKIKINGKEFEINDSTELNISFIGNLEKLSVNEELSQQSATIIGNRVIYVKNGDINCGMFSENENVFINQGITINIEGNVNNAETKNGNISVTGEVKNIKTHNGNVKTTGNVINNIETYNGTVKISGNVSGNVKTYNGNIKTGV